MAEAPLPDARARKDDGIVRTQRVKWMAGALSLAAVMLGLSGCELCENINCDGGGVGVGELSFSRGLVFVNAGSRNVSGADASDWSVTGNFTTGGGFRHPSVGPGGDSVVFAASSGSELVRVSTVGGTPSVLATADATFRDLRLPVFSPDGRDVFFTFDVGGVSAIGRVSADGTGGAVQIGGGGGTSFSSPSFDRAGRMYVVAGSAGSPATWLGRMDPTSGAFTRLATSLGNAQSVVNRARISPDGTRIAFDGRIGSGASRLFVLDLGTGQFTQLDVGSGNQTFPTWVSDTTLAFGSDEGGADQVYLVPAAGGSPTLIIPSALQPDFGPR